MKIITDGKSIGPCLVSLARAIRSSITDDIWKKNISKTVGVSCTYFNKTKLKGGNIFNISRGESDWRESGDQVIDSINQTVAVIQVTF